MRMPKVDWLKVSVAITAATVAIAMVAVFVGDTESFRFLMVVALVMNLDNHLSLMERDMDFQPVMSVRFTPEAQDDAMRSLVRSAAEKDADVMRLENENARLLRVVEKKEAEIEALREALM